MPVLGNDLRVVTIYGFYETPSWQLGDDFFRFYCAAIDMQSGQIGFSKQVKNPPKDKAIIRSNKEDTNTSMKIVSHTLLMILMLKVAVF